MLGIEYNAVGYIFKVPKSMLHILPALQSEHALCGLAVPTTSVPASATEAALAQDNVCPKCLDCIVEGQPCVQIIELHGDPQDS